MVYVCLMLPPGNGVDQRASQVPSYGVYYPMNLVCWQ